MEDKKPVKKGEKAPILEGEKLTEQPHKCKSHTHSLLTPPNGIYRKPRDGYLNDKVYGEGLPF